WIAGLSTIGSISLGVDFVAGRNRVPRPAAGMTALRMLMPGRLAPPPPRGRPSRPTRGSARPARGPRGGYRRVLCHDVTMRRSAQTYPPHVPGLEVTDLKEQLRRAIRAERARRSPR